MGFFDWLSGFPDIEKLKEKKDVEGLIKALKSWYHVRDGAAEALER